MLLKELTVQTEQLINVSDSISVLLYQLRGDFRSVGIIDEFNSPKGFKPFFWERLRQLAQFNMSEKLTKSWDI